MPDTGSTLKQNGLLANHNQPRFGRVQDRNFPELPAHLRQKKVDDPERREWVFLNHIKPNLERLCGNWSRLPQTYEEYKERYRKDIAADNINADKVEQTLEEFHNVTNKTMIDTFIWYLTMIIEAIKSLLSSAKNINDEQHVHSSPGLTR